jgi:hypothetical protein
MLNTGVVKRVIRLTYRRMVHPAREAGSKIHDPRSKIQDLFRWSSGMDSIRIQPDGLIASWPAVNRYDMYLSQNDSAIFIRMAGGPRPSYAQQFFFTLRWLSALVFLLTGGLTWQLMLQSKSPSRDAWLDLPGRPVCATTATSTADTSSSTRSDLCEAEYQRVARDRTPGLTKDDLERSRALMGNRHRLAGLARKLQQRIEPVTAVICGGSISIGHGVVP